MNNIDSQYQALLQDILDNGVKKSDRTGTGTISVFGRQIRHKMSEGFPLLTTKKMHWKSIVVELLWFLRGDTNIKYLVDNGCHIWDGDAYKRYAIIAGMSTQVKSLTKEEFVEHIKIDSEFAAKWGELGPIYGKQWRAWEHFIRTGEPIIEAVDSEDTVAVSITPQGIECEIDQIAEAIHKLKTNPDDRGIIVSAWNVGELNEMVLRPCHYGFQIYTRELNSQERKDLYDKTNYTKDIFPTDQGGWNSLFDGYHIPKRAISLMWNQRSVDSFLGLPFNIASYALLLQILGHLTNMVPDELIGNLGDTHLYSNHTEQAKEQISRSSYKLPTVHINGEFWLPNFEDAKAQEMGCSNTPGSFSDDFEALIKGIEIDDFILEDYRSRPAIKAPLSN